MGTARHAARHRTGPGQRPRRPRRARRAFRPDRALSARLDGGGHRRRRPGLGPDADRPRPRRSTSVRRCTRSRARKAPRRREPPPPRPTGPAPRDGPHAAAASASGAHGRPAASEGRVRQLPQAGTPGPYGRTRDRRGQRPALPLARPGRRRPHLRPRAHDPGPEGHHRHPPDPAGGAGSGGVRPGGRPFRPRLPRGSGDRSAVSGAPPLTQQRDLATDAAVARSVTRPKAFRRWRTPARRTRRSDAR